MRHIELSASKSSLFAGLGNVCGNKFAEKRNEGRGDANNGGKRKVTGALEATPVTWLAREKLRGSWHPHRRPDEK